MPLPAYASPNDVTNTLLYAVPAGSRAAVDINISALAACTAKIAITTNATPTALNWLEAGRVLGPGDTLERTRIMLSAGCRIYVQTDTPGAISAQAYGIEEAV